MELIVATFLERYKEQLEEVALQLLDVALQLLDVALQLLDVALQSFGGFQQYHISSSATPQEPQRLGVDVFQLMMSSSRQQSVRLSRKEPAQNQKDKPGE